MAAHNHVVDIGLVDESEYRLRGVAVFDVGFDCPIGFGGAITCAFDEAIAERSVTDTRLVFRIIQPVRGLFDRAGGTIEMREESVP